MNLNRRVFTLGAALGRRSPPRRTRSSAGSSRSLCRSRQAGRWMPSPDSCSLACRSAWARPSSSTKGRRRGSIGAAQAARSAPDGRTWLFVFDSHAVNPFLQKLTFDTERDLVPVFADRHGPNVLATHPMRPFRSLADVVAAAKAKPGMLSYATIGAGSLGHLTMVRVGKRLGIELNHCPIAGAGLPSTTLSQAMWTSSSGVLPDQPAACGERAAPARPVRRRTRRLRATQGRADDWLRAGSPISNPKRGGACSHRRGHRRP